MRKLTADGVKDGEIRKRRIYLRKGRKKNDDSGRGREGDGARCTSIYMIPMHRPVAKKNVGIFCQPH